MVIGLPNPDMDILQAAKQVFNKGEQVSAKFMQHIKRCPEHPHAKWTRTQWRKWKPPIDFDAINRTNFTISNNSFQTLICRQREKIMIDPNGQVFFLGQKRSVLRILDWPAQTASRQSNVDHLRGIAL